MKNLNLMTPINTLGYGVVGLNVLKAISKNVHVSLSLIGNADVSPENGQIVQSCINNLQTFDAKAPCLKIWHEFALAERVGRGPTFAFPFFEISELDEKRIRHLSSVDGIIVASQWAKDIIDSYKEISTPVSVVPAGVDRSIFKDIDPIDTKTCVFFNAGKWEKRKGHDVLLRMFKAAFPNESDVALHMMSSNIFLSPKQTNEWERYYKSDPRVKVLDRVAGHVEVAQAMSAANCGIFPSRAEGWNLELLEMMSMGKHIIATNYSAHTAFCNSKNSSLIEIEKLETAEDELFFNGSVGQWASLEGKPFKQGVQYMRDFYEEWKLNPNIINQEGISTAKSLSWTNTANKLQEIIYGN
tara:strand:- start:5930 stop:6997 length:1068 start_codon:yes stop_codon:yes gene_type:complete